MSTYGRNVSFRVPPRAHERGGRYATPTSAINANKFVLGAGVINDGVNGFDDHGRQTVTYASSATPPVKGVNGLLIYEYGAGDTWAGVDPYLTTYSDFDHAPFAAAVQVISGPNVKVTFVNTSTNTFLNTRSYTGRTMVSGLTAVTPSVAVGNYLEPVSSPSDAGPFWQVTATKANAWFVVTQVDTARVSCDAQFLF